MELGPQNHNGDGLLGLNSIIVVYMECLGTRGKASRTCCNNDDGNGDPGA